jgi:hypothetical protein
MVYWLDEKTPFRCGPHKNLSFEWPKGIDVSKVDKLCHSTRFTPTITLQKEMLDKFPFISLTKTFFRTLLNFFWINDLKLSIQDRMEHFYSTEGQNWVLLLNYGHGFKSPFFKICLLTWPVLFRATTGAGEGSKCRWGSKKKI